MKEDGAASSRASRLGSFILHPERRSADSLSASFGALGNRRADKAYSCPRVIHRSEESLQELLPAASVNNSAPKNLAMTVHKLSPPRENTHRPATNDKARCWTPSDSPSSQAMRWSLTNTQRRTAWISRSHYKPFARTGQRVLEQKLWTHH